MKKHVAPPFSLNGVYSFIIYVNFYSKMQNKKYLRGHRQKIAQQARQKQGQRPRVFTTMQNR